MPLYESVFIARQDIPAAQIETLSNSFADIVRANGGQVTKTEQWGLRNLAYRINKNKKGHYVLFNIEADAAAIGEMERNMRLNEDILRFQTIRVDEHETGPSAMLRRDERAERPMGERGFDRHSDRGGDRGADRGGDRAGERGGDRPRRAPIHSDAPIQQEGEAI
jgi:small subunit ribosomal protein S6